MAEVIQFNRKDHHFYSTSKESLELDALKLPLSVTLQVTRNCNLSCIYCSEATRMPDPSISTIRVMLMNLKGVRRLIFSGGEPLVRGDIISVLELANEQRFEVISLATNGTLIDTPLAEKLVDLVHYVDVTIDGPRKIHNEIRGNYDSVIRGIEILKDLRIPFSIVTVVFHRNADSILQVCRIAHRLGARKLKIMTPISKGKGKAIVSERLNSDEVFEVFKKIRSEKEKNEWSPRITLTDWSKIGEGHAILVHPNGEVVASPVPSAEDCVRPIGNVIKQKVGSIWQNYPYKKNHLSKYMEKTLHVC